MKQFFVIGNKASKSLSPTIFNHWFKKYKINANYSFVEVTKENFNKYISKKIKDKNTYGFNVTIPFRKNILNLNDSNKINPAQGKTTTAGSDFTFLQQVFSNLRSGRFASVE